MRILLISLAILSALATPGTAVAYSNGPDTGGVSAGSKTSKTVRPCKEHTNEDGVKVVNNCGSGGNASIDPKKGDANSKTKVKTKTGFKGDISGLDANDKVDLGSSNTANVSGNGGTVNVAGGSTVNVSNGTAGGNITINMPSGSSITLPPGSSITVTT